MSILKSTKSGKSAIKLTITYLTDNHWHWKAPSNAADIDYNKIWKNQKDYLNLIYDRDRKVISIYLRYCTEKFAYTFYVKTLADLELVECFWQKLRKDKGNAAKFLKENAPSTQISEESNTFFDGGLTNEINKKIIARMDRRPYVDNSLQGFWKPVKNYFASYFK